jgi:hypothetical protein
MNLESLFAQFVKERRFMDNVTDRTISWYHQSWRAFTRTVILPEKLDKQVLNDFVTKLREGGLPESILPFMAPAINL